MKPITIKPQRSLLAHLALVGATLPLLGVQVANAQDDLHPDWSQVWDNGGQQQDPNTMTVPANVIIPVTLDNSLSSATARVGDIVTATPITKQDGDSEFPPGTRIGGVVSQAQSASNSTPGVLDVDFQSALLPDGTEIPVHGFIASLDSNAVTTRDGHLIARDGSHVNAWKAVGIGGGAGFVLGRLLKTDSLLPTILGAAGGYLYARSKSRHGEEANINAGTALGVRLESPVDFPDPDHYASARLRYLETHRDYSPDTYGWNEAIAAAPRYHYYDYDYINTCPSWVTVSPYDYYNFPIFPIFISYRHTYYRDPRWYGGNSYWNRPVFHRGPQRNTWDYHGSRDWNDRPSYNNGNRNSNWNNRPYGASGGNNTHYSGSGGRNSHDNSPGSWNNRPSTSGNRGTAWASSGGNYTGSKSGVTTGSWIGRPDGSSHHDTPATNTPAGQAKPTLPPISANSTNLSNRGSSGWNTGNWGSSNSGSRSDTSRPSERDSGVSVPRFNSSSAGSRSNTSTNHDSFNRGWGGNGGGGGSRGGGGRSSSGGGRSGRR